MAIVQSSSAAATIDAVLARARRMVGDTETDTANQRFSDADLLDDGNLELIKMATVLGVIDPGPALTYADLTYTASATEMTLPAGPLTQPIYQVEDITNGVTKASVLERASISQIDVINSTDPPGRQRYIVVGNTIALRPVPAAARTLRIRYIRAPYVMVDGVDAADQHSMPIGAEELISLGIAMRALRTDEERPDGLERDYNQAWAIFLAASKRHRGQKVVVKKRRWG